jgi:hypothetical protein
MKKEELPVEYIPMNLETVSKEIEFKPVYFRVSSQTDAKTKSLLENSSLEGSEKINFSYVMPSDLWGQARVLSNYYERINEALIMKSKWEIFGGAFPNELLCSESVIKGLKTIQNLPFVYLESITKNEKGDILIKSLEQMLLLNEVNHRFYEEKLEASFVKNPDYSCDREVYFRHIWNENKWKNNIHTKYFAQKFGFREEIPEFSVYMDWIFLSLENPFEAYNGTEINLRKILPLYKGDKLRITRQKIQNKEVVRANLKENNSERFVAFVKTK